MLAIFSLSSSSSSSESSILLSLRYLFLLFFYTNNAKIDLNDGKWIQSQTYPEADAQVFFQELVIFIFEVAVLPFVTAGWFFFTVGIHTGSNKCQIGNVGNWLWITVASAILDVQTLQTALIQNFSSSIVGGGTSNALLRQN